MERGFASNRSRGTQSFAQALSQNREATTATFRSEKITTHDTAHRQSDKQWRETNLLHKLSPPPTPHPSPLSSRPRSTRQLGFPDPLSLLDLVFHTGFEERILLGLLLAEPLYRPHPFPSTSSCDPKLLARLCVLAARAAPLVLARASEGGLTSADKWRAPSVVRDR